MIVYFRMVVYLGRPHLFKRSALTAKAPDLISTRWRVSIYLDLFTEGTKVVVRWCQSEYLRVYSE